MERVFIKTVKKILRFAIVFIIIFSWTFGGWPVITGPHFGNLTFEFPPKIREARADTIIFTETCASNPTQPFNTSTTITVGTSWSARITLVGTPTTTINSGTGNCSPLADTTNIGFGYTMTPAPTTNEYYVDYVWIDGGAISATSGNGQLFNYIDTNNYYACMLKDDATPDAYIYKVSGGVGSTLASNVDRTVASNNVIECRINYNGSSPVITMTNITTATQLVTATDSTSPLMKTGKAGVYCGAIPAATGDDCESALDFDTVRLSTVPDPIAPTVSTQAATLKEATTATCNGTITATGGVNATNAGCEWDIDTGAPYANTASTAGDYGAAPFTQALSGLPSGTTIYARAFATNSAGTGYGGETSWLTKPVAPTALNFTSVAATNLRLNWTASTGAASYKVERCTGTGCSSWAEIATGVTNVYYDDSARTGNTVYRYQARATNATGDSAYSSGAEQLMFPDVPGTPTFSGVTGTSITVNWNGSTGGSSNNYYVERAPDVSGSPGSWTEVGTNVTSPWTNNTGLTCNTTYWYKVRGNNATGYGSYSGNTSQLTGSCNTAPSFSVIPADSPDPVVAGYDVTFSGTATDSESNSWYLAVCKTNSITAANPPTCAASQTYCVSSSAVATGSQNTCAWTSNSTGAQTWYAFACDNNASPLCSSNSNTNSPITVNAQSLTFSISNTVIFFGTLSASAAKWADNTADGSATEVAGHTISASTNASSGYIITVNGTTLKSVSAPGDTITAIASTSDVTAGIGSEQFGIRVTASGGDGVPVSPYNSAANNYTLITTAFPDVIASDANGNDVATTYSVFYAANIASNTEAHTDYSATLNYVATATF